MPKSKVFATFAEAVRDVPDGSVVGFGGFAVVGMPINLYKALAEQGAKGLTCVSNGTRGGATLPADGPDMGWLIQNGQVKTQVPYYVKRSIAGKGVSSLTLKAGQQSSDALSKELVAWVRKEIGPIATPDVIQWAPGLPKTRSGKIMRRILRKIAENDFGNLGDTSTLADPGVVEDLVKNRAK